MAVRGNCFAAFATLWQARARRATLERAGADYCRKLCCGSVLGFMLCVPARFSNFLPPSDYARKPFITRLRVGEGLVGHIAAVASPLALADAQSHPNFAYRPETGEEIFLVSYGCSLLCGRVVGVLVVQNRIARDYNEEDVKPSNHRHGGLRKWSAAAN